jgi:hypothetical protein
MSTKTRAYLDGIAERINHRGDGLQESDITEVKIRLGAYNRQTIRVNQYSPEQWIS